MISSVTVGSGQGPRESLMASPRLRPDEGPQAGGRVGKSGCGV